MEGSRPIDAPPFDEAHYHRQFSQPIGTPDLLAHYQVDGWRQGLDPHPLFSTGHYLAHAGEAVARSGLDPLTHFMRVGAAAGMPFHPCFDVGHYRLVTGGRDADANPLLHYLHVGAASGLAPCEIFDAQYYRTGVGQDAGVAADPLSHYLSIGWRRGFAFHPYFDPDWYMAQPGSGTRSPIPLVDFLLAPAAARNPPQAFTEPRFGRELLAAGICPHHDLMAQGFDRQPPRPLNALLSDGWFARDGGSAGAYFARRRRHRAAGRRRMVFVGHDAARAGAQMILLRLMEHAAASGTIEPFVILAQGGPLADAYAATGHLLIARPGETADAVVRKLLARLADDPPAGAIVSTVVLPDYVAALAAAGLAPDVLVHETADMYPAETQADIARNARRLVFASRDTEARFRQRVPGTHRGEVIYTGATLTPNVTPEPTGDPIVLGCGTVTWRKGVDRFVEVARRTVAAVGDEIPVRFVWVGARPDAGQGAADFWAEFDVGRLGLGDRFRFEDEVSDTAPLYAGATVMLSTARTDPFPGVVLEAMASGRPVIAFADSGGAPEALEGGAGIVVPYGDTAAMADALIGLLRAPEERRRIGETARARVASRFRYPDYAAAILRPFVPTIRAQTMEGTVMAPVVAAVAPQAAAPATPAPQRQLDPAGESVLVVADGRDPEAAVLALNLAAFLRRSRNLVLMLCDGRPYTSAARAAADVVLATDAAMLRDPRGLREELDRAADRFALRRAILVGDLPPTIAATLAGRFLPAVLVATRAPVDETAMEAALWAQAIVVPTAAIERAVKTAFPGRPSDDLHRWPASHSRIWTDPGPDRFAAAERLRAALAGGAAAGAALVLGSGPPTLEGGIDLFLRTAAMLSGPGAPRFAWICSPGTAEGAEWKALRRRIARSPRHRHVLLWGTAPTLQPAYEAAGLFLSTARSEWIPLAAVGAIEHGLPIVAFADGGALPELLASDTGTARGVVPDLDTAAAAALVGHLAATPSARAPQATAAARLAGSFVTMADWVERIDRLAVDRAPTVAAEQRDFATILADEDFDLEEFGGDARANRPAAVLRHVRSWRCRQALRRPAPGIHPGLLARADGPDDPYAAHLRAGKPPGPGRRPVIRPGPRDGARGNLRAALHLHLYHADQTVDLLRRVTVNGRRCDLILTTDTAAKAREIEWQAAGISDRRVRILVLPNHGRNLGPLLTGLGPGLLGEYEVIGHVHGKKTAHRPRELVGPWRERLLQALLGDAHPMMDRILAAFEADPGLGLVYPDDPNLLGWDEYRGDALPPEERSTRPAALELARRLGWDGLPAAFDFPVGAMFWARTAALKPLFDLGLGWADYPAEPVADNGTMLHALERLFCLVAERAGYRVAASHVPGFPR